jgi:hypothetical protein
MIHPFSGDLTQLKDNELEEKLFELNKKYSIASRLGDPELLTQVETFVIIYREEMSRRHLSKAIGGQDNDLDQLINVD